MMRDCGSNFGNVTVLAAASASLPQVIVTGDCSYSSAPERRVSVPHTILGHAGARADHDTRALRLEISIDARRKQCRGCCCCCCCWGSSQHGAQRMQRGSLRAKQAGERDWRRLWVGDCSGVDGKSQMQVRAAVDECSSSSGGGGGSSSSVCAIRIAESSRNRRRLATAANDWKDSSVSRLSVRCTSLTSENRFRCGVCQVQIRAGKAMRRPRTFLAMYLYLLD